MRHWRMPAVFAAAIVVVFTFVATTIATPPPGHKVTICHATNSATNPYVRESVDIASSGYLKAGHSWHTGPIFSEGAKDQHVKWGDIIPPYDYAVTSFHFAGLNWTDAGQAIWENGCDIPGETVVPSASFESSEAPATDVPSTSPSVDPSFGASVEAATDVPVQPPTSTLGAKTSAPDSSAGLLLVVLAALTGSVLFLTPRSSRGKR